MWRDPCTAGKRPPLGTSASRARWKLCARSPEPATAPGFGAEPARRRGPAQLPGHVLEEENSQQDPEQKSSPNISAAFKNSFHGIQSETLCGPDRLLPTEKN